MLEEVEMSEKSENFGEPADPVFRGLESCLMIKIPLGHENRKNTISGTNAADAADAADAPERGHRRRDKPHKPCACFPDYGRRTNSLK